MANARSRFFLLGSFVILILVACGFGPTLFLRPLFGTTDRFTGSAALPVRLLVHGLALTGWFAFLATQTTLVAMGLTRIHRRLGMIGGVLAIAVVVTSAITMHRVVPRVVEAAASRGAADPSAQTAMLQRATEVIVHDFWTLVVFVVLVTCALHFRACRP